MNGKILFLLIAGIIGTSVFGAHFGVKYGQAMWGNKDMWWTPRSMALSLGETRGVFRMFLSGRPLAEQIEEGALFAVSGEGDLYKVAPADIAVRLNNWQKVKAGMLEGAVVTALFLGASVTLLLTGGIRLVRERHGRPETGS